MVICFCFDISYYLKLLYKYTVHRWADWDSCLLIVPLEQYVPLSHKHAVKS